MQGKRRVLCVWFPRLAVECLDLAPERCGARVTVAHGGMTVTGVSAAAEAAGVRPGMQWGDARARYPSLVASRPDPAQEERRLRAAARLAERYGPWVVRGTDDLRVDVSGAAHLFGGERAMLEDAGRVFRTLGLSARAAVAGTPAAAWALARFAATELTVGSPQAVRALPVEALRIDAEAAARLRRVGLRHIGDLAGRSRTALADRFGERLTRRLDRILGAGGLGSEPLGVRAPPPELRTGWEGVETLASPASVEAACARLLGTLCARLRKGERGARKMVLTLCFDDPAAPRRVEVRAGRGLRDPGRWLALFRERGEAFDPGRGVARIELEADEAEPFDPEAGGGPEDLWERLSARLGSESVVRFRPVGRHRPEAAFRMEPGLEGAKPGGLEWPRLGGEQEGGARPLRLLNPPEPVRVVPDGPDAPDAELDPPAGLRRRGRTVRLRRAEGPERIGFEWWCEDPAERDYWRVETETGARWWIFREAHPVPRWFLHGIFP